jgi:hypothetical protein
MEGNEPMAAMNYGNGPQKRSGFGQINTQVLSSSLGAAAELLRPNTRRNYVAKHVSRNSLLCCSCTEM